MELLARTRQRRCNAVDKVRTNAQNYNSTGRVQVDVVYIIYLLYLHLFALIRHRFSIRSGILRYNEQNKEKINRGYNETVTMFYINVINDALSRDNNAQIDTFEEFIERNSYVIDRHLLFEYYSDELLNRKEAKTV